MKRIKDPVESNHKRFWEKVKKERLNDCWLWVGYRNKTGYGYIWDSTTKKLRRSHRVSWEMCYGKIPDGLYICHSCDNPSCVNPDHLYSGTQSDNLKDCVRKGRHNLTITRGSQKGNSKLTEDDVVALRRESSEGMNTTKLSRKYGVSRWQIREIVMRRGWTHV